MSERFLLVITGPTGSGKTALSIELAKQLGCSIISADSRQLFKEIPIGSAAPSIEEMRDIPHFFVGSKSISEEFNAGKFEQEALSLLEKLFEENPVQIVCGGTGLYIKALLHGMDDLPKSSPEMRAELELQWHIDSEVLKTELKELDPEYCQSADLSNKQRVIRALEVSRLSGKKYSELRTNVEKKRNFEFRILALDLPRETLYERINARTLSMIENGWLEEAKAVLSYKDCNALRTVGYQELFAFLDGMMTLEEAISLIQQNTRRYAKRQVTWIRHQEKVEWISPTMNYAELAENIKRELT
jgi:tRNA dimethylallyltransferase